MTPGPRRSDAALRRQVEQELVTVLGTQAARVGVRVTGGAVTLTGEVENRSLRRRTEQLVTQVQGVHAIVVRIRVPEVNGDHDPELAEAVSARIAAAVDFAPDDVTAFVEGGVATLTGKVPWPYQRETAERCVRHVQGVRHVHNELEVTTGLLEA